MAGKPQKNKYAWFGNLVVSAKRGRMKLRPEFVPSFIALLMSIGKQYDNAHRALGGDLARDRCEAADSARTYYSVAVRVIQHLINLSVETFSEDTWQQAVNAVREGMGIGPDAEVIENPDPSVMAPNPEIPAHAGKQPRRRRVVHEGARHGEVRGAGQR